jgi:excinuclease ABC subunit B
VFKLKTEFNPKGDQPEAIKALSNGVLSGKKSQVLLGITGSGKTFTMANIIQKVQRPTLILAHNKTLAAQLYQEFKAFFPDNAVEYFVSYYDYYQPEAYIARTDTYIEKDLAINDQIERMRLSATRNLMEREDVIIIASVSCIYGLGAPENYSKMIIHLNKGDTILRDDLLIHLIKLHHTRNDMELARGNFRVRGDIVEIVPAYETEIAYRIEFFGDEIERISEIDPLTGKVRASLTSLSIYPGSHYVTPDDIKDKAITSIQNELEERIAYFKERNALIEEQRIRERTRYDLEMIKEIGFCKGIENYSRHFSTRSAGEAPSTLIDYFPDNFLFFIDESHQSVPQVRAMYNGDRARKETLINYGFRLPSAFDNRPLKFEEFYEKLKTVVYVSATPNPWEVEESAGEIVQQIIRPTGLLDPICEIKKAEFQVDDCMEEIQKEIAKGGRILVTTLTKKLAEDLSNYLKEVGIKAKYLHSEILTLERIQIIKELREGKFDVLVGINLLREGLDIPEVSLVAILDADKEGFLRSETSLIQTCGRAARNANGRVILYADKMTKSIQACLTITENRRKIQQEYNKVHGITPQTTLRKKAQTLLESFGIEEIAKTEGELLKLTPKAINKKIRELEDSMLKAAKELHFEEAARFRDELRHYRSLQLLED